MMTAKSLGIRPRLGDSAGMTRTLFFAALAAALFTGSAHAQDAEAAPVAHVAIRKDGDDWSARYRFDAEAPAWLFTRSALALETEAPWRPEQFELLTPGVTLERRGFYDVLMAEDGSMPETVDVRLTPLSTNLLADYDPALTFSDGAIALFTAHFEVMPLVSAAIAETLPSDIDASGLESGPTEVTLSDAAGPVLAHGERHEVAELSEHTYVLFGAGEAVETDAVASLIDPGLPAWMGDELNALTPRMLAYYQERLGPKAGERPTVMVAWRGPTPSFRSMGGSVLTGMVVMSFEGDAILTPDRETLNAARWFIGHESAHFWLGQTIHHALARDSWISEGGADLMAIRASRVVDPQYDDHSILQSAVDDCVALADQPIAEAGDRNEHRANYACGSLFYLAAEGAARQTDPTADVFTVLKPLIDAHRDADPAVDIQDWLAWFTPIAGEEAAGIISALVETGSSDPAADLARLFDLTGVEHGLGEGGRLMLAAS